MPDQTIPSSVRGDLSAERDRLTAQIDSLEPGRSAGQVDDNFADSGQVAAHCDAVLAQMRRGVDAQG